MECGRKNVARTYVWADDNAVVWAYFSLAPDKVRRADLPRAIGRGDPNEIPAVLIGKLALHDVLQGQGLGRQLLVDALSRGRQRRRDRLGPLHSCRCHRRGRRRVLSPVRLHARLPAPSASRLIMKSSDASASLVARRASRRGLGPKEMAVKVDYEEEPGALRPNQLPTPTKATGRLSRRPSNEPQLHADFGSLTASSHC